jgi:hypothetical protein
VIVLVTMKVGSQDPGRRHFHVGETRHLHVEPTG